MYLQLRNQGWPKDRYRLLCFNCNQARAYFGKCPHEYGRGKPLQYLSFDDDFPYNAT